MNTQEKKKHEDMKFVKLDKQTDRIKVIKFCNRIKDKKEFKRICKNKYGWTEEYFDSFMDVQFYRVNSTLFFGWLAKRIDHNGHILVEDLYIENAMQSYLHKIEMYAPEAENMFNDEEIYEGYLAQNGFNKEMIIKNPSELSVVTGLEFHDIHNLFNNKPESIMVKSASLNRDLANKMATSIAYDRSKSSKGDKVEAVSADLLATLSEWDCKDMLNSMIGSNTVVIFAITTELINKMPVIKNFIQLRKDSGNKCTIIVQDDVAGTIGINGDSKKAIVITK